MDLYFHPVVVLPAMTSELYPTTDATMHTGDPVVTLVILSLLFLLFTSLPCPSPHSISLSHPPSLL